MSKQCNGCDQSKPLSEFHKNKRAKDGLAYRCKSCAIANTRKHYKENREDAVAYRRKYVEDKRDSVNESAREYHHKNRESCNQKSKAYYSENKERLAALSADYRAGNPEEVKESQQKTYMKYRSERLARNSQARAERLKRSPAWLTSQHKEAIRQVFIDRDSISLRTGVEHHVDHIVPLRGKTVSGLHVPWNLQVITASENLSKGNSFKEAVNA